MSASTGQRSPETKANCGGLADVLEVSPGVLGASCAMTQRLSTCMAFLLLHHVTPCPLLIACTDVVGFA